MFSSTFQSKFNFQGLFKKLLYIQVLFKPVRTLSKQKDPDQTAPFAHTFPVLLIQSGTQDVMLAKQFTENLCLVLSHKFEMQFFYYSQLKFCL